MAETDARSLPTIRQSKPFRRGGPYFSFSHCKTGIAVAVADEPVGIDIESIRRADEELMERVLNNDERLAVSGERDRDRAFTKLWTQKEAVVKMLGTGIESFEQLQNILSGSRDHETTRPRKIETIEKANYIYSIAYLSLGTDECAQGVLKLVKDN